MSARRSAPVPRQSFRLGIPPYLAIIGRSARAAIRASCGGSTDERMTARKYDSRRFRASATLASLVVALAFLSASDILISQAQETALDRYVNSRDPVYGWKLIHTAHGEGYQAFVLELTSQTWRTAAEVDRPVWKHWLTIVKPLRTTSRTAMLFIGGGSNDNPAPTTADATHHQLRPRIEHRCRRSGNGAESAAGVLRLEGSSGDRKTI